MKAALRGDKQACELVFNSDQACGKGHKFLIKRLVVRRALLHLSRARFPGTEEAATESLWAVWQGDVSPGMDVLVFRIIEELAVNDLRETFNRRSRALALPANKDAMGEVLPRLPKST